MMPLSELKTKNLKTTHNIKKRRKVTRRKKRKKVAKQLTQW